jgi:CheY-like chemotaxis protein
MLKTGEERPLPTLLLVDDDMVSREVMSTVLSICGYTVHSADGGQAALELLAAGDCVPDVILMDTQMPGLSGVRLVAELRAVSPARLVAISGSRIPDAVTAAADGFLQKPLDPDALAKLLQNCAASAEVSLSSPAPIPEMVPNAPIVDQETFAQLRRLMSPSALREVYAAVVADLYARLAVLETARVQGNAAEVRRLGHSIKGGCQMTGALQAARLGALLETSSNQLDNVDTLLGDLRNAADSLQRMLDTEFPA